MSIHDHILATFKSLVASALNVDNIFFNTGRRYHMPHAGVCSKPAVKTRTTWISLRTVALNPEDYIPACCAEEMNEDNSLIKTSDGANPWLSEVVYEIETFLQVKPLGPHGAKATFQENIDALHVLEGMDYHIHEFLSTDNYSKFGHPASQLEAAKISWALKLHLTKSHRDELFDYLANYVDPFVPRGQSTFTQLFEAAERAGLAQELTSLIERIKLQDTDDRVALVLPLSDKHMQGDRLYLLRSLISLVSNSSGKSVIRIPPQLFSVAKEADLLRGDCHLVTTEKLTEEEFATLNSFYDAFSDPNASPSEVMEKALQSTLALRK